MVSLRVADFSYPVWGWFDELTLYHSENHSMSMLTDNLQIDKKKLNVYYQYYTDIFPENSEVSPELVLNSLARVKPIVKLRKK